MGNLESLAERVYYGENFGISPFSKIFAVAFFKLFLNQTMEVFFTPM